MRKLRGGFGRAILFKNSFGSALSCRLAGMNDIIGYARQGRSLLLSEKLYPPRLPGGPLKPVSVIDYYLAIASHLGAAVDDRTLELPLEPQAMASVKSKLPALFERKGPLVVFVPGAAAGLNKCWLPERFAATADKLATSHNATVVLSVAPSKTERDIAAKIIAASKRRPVSTADYSVNLAELKAIFSIADLVITNDTGPRHIAVAFGRKIITLTGPNDLAWTHADYANEIRIAGHVPCAPCDRHTCNKPRHLCMEAISVETVCRAAEQLLGQAPAGQRAGRNSQGDRDA
jgi:heptosyltransferase-2